MSSTTMTPAIPEPWKNVLHAACAEIVREEAEAFRRADTSAVVFDRRYLARRRRMLRQVNHPILWQSRKYLPHAAVFAIVTVLASAAVWQGSRQPGVTPGPGEDPEQTTATDTATTSAPPITTTDYDANSVSPSGGWKTEHITVDDATYTIEVSVYEDYLTLRGISSTLAHVTVPTRFDWHTRPELRTNLTDVDLPNTRRLTFAEGWQKLTFRSATWGRSETETQFPSLQVLELPATLETFQYTSDRMEQLVEEHWLQIAPQLADLGAYMNTVIYKLSGYGNLEYTFPLDLASLQEIRVAEGNEHFWDEDGILYSNSYLQMANNSGIYPKKQLICLPRDYQNTVNIWVPYEKYNKKRVNIPEGTEYIHTGAVYHCSIDYLYIPSTVTYIAPAAIVATEERPLTIIAEVGSAAFYYVREFGEKYHLKHNTD